MENHAPHLVDSARRLHGANGAARRADLVRLAQGLVDDSVRVREAVRVLIFSPPMEEELHHFRRLLRWLPDWLPPAWCVDPLLRRLVAEMASSTDNPQSCHPIATLLQIALRVAPTADPVKQIGEFYPVLFTSAGAMAFGTYYGQTLRQLALQRLGFSEKKSQANHTHSPLELLWDEYAQLANLL